MGREQFFDRALLLKIKQAQKEQQEVLQQQLKHPLPPQQQIPIQQEEISAFSISKEVEIQKKQKRKSELLALKTGFPALNALTESGGESGGEEEGVGGKEEEREGEEEVEREGRRVGGEEGGRALRLGKKFEHGLVVKIISLNTGLYFLFFSFSFSFLFFCCCYCCCYCCPQKKGPPKKSLFLPMVLATK